MPTSAHCGGPSLAVEAEEQAHRRAEEVEVAGELAKARRPVLAGDADGGVEVFAALKRRVRNGSQRSGRIDVVFRLFHGRGGDDRLERRQRLAGQGVDPPGLQIAAGWRAMSALQDRLDHRAGDRIGLERPHRHAPGRRLADIHVFLASLPA